MEFGFRLAAGKGFGVSESTCALGRKEGCCNTSTPPFGTAEGYWIGRGGDLEISTIGGY